MSSGVRHPGGTGMTEYLLELAGIHPPAEGKAADLGAGEGNTVKLLSRYGYDAVGIDIEPGENVIAGDMLQLPFEDETFDLVISECAMYQTQRQTDAIKEALRVLKKDGIFLIADLFPLKRNEMIDAAQEWGAQLLFLKDHTSYWKDYIIDRLWKDEYISEVCQLADQKCRYYLAGMRGKRYE